MPLISIIIFLFLSWLCLTRLKFFRESGMTAPLLFTLFAIKVLTGFFVGWFTLDYFQKSNDYLTLHSLGIAEKEILIHQPAEYIRELFRSSYENGRGGWFDSTGSYWNDLRNNLIVKFLALLNVLTGGSYYSNSIFFNFFSFAGQVALYRLTLSLYGKTLEKPILFIIFLIPSTLFFSSGIHKDLIILTAVSFILYLFHAWVNDKLSRPGLLILILSFLIVLLIRNYVLMALLPAMAAYYLCKRRKIRPVLAFGITYAMVLTTMLIWSGISSKSSPLQVIVNKREDFLQLGKANSDLPRFALEPNMASFVRHFPTAIENGFLRPFLGEGIHPLHKAAGVEIFMLALLIIVGFWKMRRQPLKAFEWLMICFAISGILFIGYIVPNYGSIIRYRSLYLPILLAPFAVRALAKKHIIL